MITKNHQTIQDKLAGALIGLAKTCTAHPGDAATDQIILDGLRTLSKYEYLFEIVSESVPGKVAELNKQMDTNAQTQTNAQTRVNTDMEDTCVQMLDKVHLEKKKVAPDCATCLNPCGNTDDYDMNEISKSQESIQIMKMDILQQLYKLAGQENQADTPDEAQMKMIYKGLCVLGYEMTEERLKKAHDEIGAIEIDK